MLAQHARERHDESFLGNLLTLVLLLALVAGGGAFLYAVGGPPHLPNPFPSWDDVAFTLRGSEVPSSTLIYVSSTLGWLILGYLGTATLLRVVVDLLAAGAREHPLARALRAVSDGLTIPLLRRIVDGVVVA